MAVLPRLVIALAALTVAAYSVAVGDWLGLAAVVVVVFALTAWRPSWLRAELGAEVEAEPPEARAVRLAELQRWRRVLVPVAVVAVGVQAWALHGLITTGEGLGASTMLSVVAALLAAWAGVTHARIEALEDGPGAAG